MNYFGWSDISEGYKLKVVITGEFGSGKTSLVNRFIQQTFNVDYRPTLGTNIMMKKINLDGIEVTLMLWDIAGHERWKSMRPLYYRGSSAALIVGDLTQKTTFDSIVTFWAPDLRKHAGNNIPILIIANKCDLTREVTPADVEIYANEIGAISSLETSAKNGDNVEEAFLRIAMEAIGKIQ